MHKEIEVQFEVLRTVCCIPLDNDRDSNDFSDNPLVGRGSTSCFLSSFFKCMPHVARHRLGGLSAVDVMIPQIAT